jgi:hypothetical protein
MSKARNLSDFISDATIDSTEIADLSVTHAKLHTDMNLSSKTLTFAANQISGNSVDGGVISNFASTGIDDNASSTAVTILSDGKVGIGTASPSRKLTVLGVNNTTNFEVTDAAGGNTFNIYNNTTSSAVAIGTSSGLMSFGFNGIDKVHFKSDGKVGIGTSSPAVALEIIGTTTSGIRIKNNALHSNGFNIYVDSSTDTAVLNNPFSGPMLFETANTERMRIDGGGNVGIGLTSNFGSIFHVNSEMSLGPDNNNRMIISSTSGGVGSIGTIEGGTASFSTMTFKGGNVGIGTANPTSKLHVDGAMVSTTLTQGSGELQIQGYGSTGYINMNGSGSLRFRMGSSYTEHMSLAPGGQLLASAAGRYTGLPSNSWVTFGRLYSAQSTPLNIKVIVGHNSSGGYNEFTNDTYAYNVAAGTVVTIGNTTGGYTCQIRKIKRIGGQNGIPGAHYNGGDGGWEYQVARNQAYSMSVGFHVMGATTGWTWTI